MARRVLTALVGIPVFLGALLLGGPYWTGLVVILALVGVLESSRLGFARAAPRYRTIGAALASAAAAVAYIGGGGGGLGAWLTGGMTLVYTAWLAYYALSMSRADRGAASSVGTAFAVSLYPAAYFAHLGLLRAEGAAAVLFPVLVTWATDTAAFFCGSRFGKRPLAPRISPNKTVEGAVGGLLFGVAVAALIGRIVADAPVAWAAIGLVASLAAQVGDLIESGIKRIAGVKDSGALLPGHGGVLDRFDSLMLSGTAVYYLLLLMR